MVDTGLYHGFNFVDSIAKIDANVIYKTPVLNAIITGDHSVVTVKSYETGASLHTATVNTWTLNDVEVKSHRINYSLAPGQRVYVDIDGTLFSDHIVEYGLCDLLQIITANDCANQYHDWENDGDYIYFLMSNATEISPEFEEESRLIINENGQHSKTTRLVQKRRMEFYAPVTYIRLFAGLRINSYVALNTPQGAKEIHNISVDVSEGETGYGVFILKYEYKDTLTHGSSCCEDVNIDTILNPDNEEGSEACVGFSASITGTETLSVSLTNTPVGTVTYKWYKNNVFLTSGATIDVTMPGNYRVDVRVGNCRATASYYKEDVCNVFDIQVTKTLNSIAATASNVPDGETVTYEVTLNGVVKSTSVPYTAVESGTYFVKATAGDCSKIKGIYVVLESDDCDFTVDVVENGSELEADTNAASPSYLWEIETGVGRTTIGTSDTVLKSGKGIYWLSVSNGECTKTDYLYIEPNTNVVCVLNKATGSEFVVTEINLLSVSPTELVVYVNGVNQTYTSGNPVAPNQYTITGAGLLKVYGTLNNATIKIIYA